jgi:hypothetical protein
VSSPNEELTTNQRTFRYANERLGSLAGEVVGEERLVPFLCECADWNCLGRVEMKLADYGELHVDRDVYAILPNHQVAEGEHVIDRRASFEVVRKSPVF